MSKRPRKRIPANMRASFIPTSRIDPNKAAAYNAQRTKAILGSGPDTEHNPNSGFMQEVPKTFTKYSKQYYMPDDGGYFKSQKGLTVQRREELKIVEHQGLFGLYRVWQSESKKQGVSQYLCRVLDESPGYWFRLFFSGDEYLFVQESLEQNTRRISRTYQGLSTAIARKRENKIAWIVTEALYKPSEP